MHRLLPAFIETAAAAVFLVPIFLYLNKVKFHNLKTTAAAFLFSLYLSIVYAMAGLPNVTYVRFQPNFNFIPFQYFFTDHTSLLNVLLFVPLGVFLPILRTKFKKFLPTVLFGLLMSMFIEVFQIFTFRATDINDLITNTVGTILGYFLGKRLLRCFPQLILTEETNELKSICISVLFVMFFLQPFLSGLIWNVIY